MSDPWRNMTHSSAPACLLSTSVYTRPEFIKPQAGPRLESSCSSLWDVVSSQQKQLTDLQRKVHELVSVMGDMQMAVADRICTPSVSGSEELRISQTGERNYKSMRVDYMRPSMSFASEWESLRKTKILALPPPSTHVQEISEDESSCASSPRASDEHANRIHRLIQKYTT